MLQVLGATLFNLVLLSESDMCEMTDAYEDINHDFTTFSNDVDFTMIQLKESEVSGGDILSRIVLYY